MRPDPALDPLRDLVADLLEIDAVNTRLGHMISAQETVYPARTGRGSRWEGRFLPNLPLTTAAGPTDLTRLLLPGRPVLLLLGETGRAHGEQAAAWAHAVRTVSATPARPLPWDAVLVRPDGYIAWASDGGSLTGALGDWFGEPRRRT